MAFTTADPSDASFLGLTPSPIANNMFAMLRNLANNGSRLYSLKSNGNVSQVSGAYATDTYVVGSAIPIGAPTIPLNVPVPLMRYGFCTDIAKTAAGVATPIVTLRIGTTGTISDPAILTFTFPAGTAASDTGTIELWSHFYSTGSGTSAVIAGSCALWHVNASTGLVGAAMGQVSAVSAGFNSQVAGLIIGVSFNGGAAFSGTTTVVEATLEGF